MQFVATGCVVRSEAKRAAVRLDRYEFKNRPRPCCRRRGSLAKSLSGAFFTMKRAAPGARIGSALLGRTAGETGTPAWRGKPTVDKIVDGRSLRKPQNAPICHRCARRAKSKHCK